MRIRLKHRRLARELAKKRISQNRWAQKLGLDRGHLSKLVRGKRPYPSRSTRQKLLGGLNLRFGDLFVKEGHGRGRGRMFVPVADAVTPSEGRGAGSLVSGFVSAARTLRARPLFSLALTLILSLGIGATTAMFSVVNQVVLKPLPYQEPDRLATVWNTYPHWRKREILSQFWDTIRLSYPEFLEWQKEQTVFQDVAVYGSQRVAYTGGSEPRIIQVGVTSRGLFDVLRVEPSLGRFFQEDEDRPQAMGTAVLSYGFWQREFGGREDAAGETIALGSSTYTIVGVAPPTMELGFSNDPDLRMALWIPLGRLSELHDEGNHAFEAIARLKDGVSLQQAQAETEAILRGGRDRGARGARVVLRKDEEISGVSESVFILFAAVAILLLLTCANAAQLLMTRASERRRELAVRMALGSGRRLVQLQLLLESGMVGLLGGALGLAMAFLFSRLIVAHLPLNLPRAEGIEIDLRVYLFALAISLASALACGLAPAWAALRVNLAEVLNEGGRGVAAGARMQWVLIGGEVALSVVLLTSSLLFVQTIVEMNRVDPGFEADDVLALSVFMPAHLYRNPNQIRAFRESSAQAISALPGVDGLAVSAVVPFSGRIPSNSVWATSWGPEEGAKPEAQKYIVGRNYFSTLKIPVLRGRAFQSGDSASNRPVAVINEAMAETFWPGKDPIGDRLIVSDRPHDIVGIVANTLDRHREGRPPTAFYLPLDQHDELEAVRSLTFLVKTSREPKAVASEARGVVWSLDSQIPITGISALASLMSASAAEARSRSIMVSAFALMALLLTGVGVYSMCALSAARRRREMGIRLALGAGRLGVFRLVLGRLLAVASAGGLLGVGLSLLGGGWLRSYLFGVDPLDAGVYLAVAGFILAVVVAGGFLPAFRAARLHPTQVLRYE